MKFLTYLVYSVSLLWLLIVGLHHVLWLLRQFALPPRSLWWFMRLPVPRLSAEGLAGMWPILVGGIGVMIGSGLHVWAERVEKQRKEGSEA